MKSFVSYDSSEEGQYVDSSESLVERIFTKDIKLDLGYLGWELVVEVFERNNIFLI